MFEAGDIDSYQGTPEQGANLHPSVWNQAGAREQANCRLPESEEI